MVSNDLCSTCGRWHDHTGKAVVAVIDWKGKAWPIPRGHMPYENTDDSGGREYGHCGASTEGRQPSSPDRDFTAPPASVQRRPIVRCPVCGQIADDAPEDDVRIEVCNGVSMGPRASLAFDQENGHPSTHAPTDVQRFTVAPSEEYPS